MSDIEKINNVLRGTIEKSKRKYHGRETREIAVTKQAMVDVLSQNGFKSGEIAQVTGHNVSYISQVKRKILDGKGDLTCRARVRNARRVVDKVIEGYIDDNEKVKAPDALRASEIVLNRSNPIVMKEFPDTQINIVIQSFMPQPIIEQIKKSDEVIDMPRGESNLLSDASSVPNENNQEKSES
jgi:hypothetical protein